MSKKKVCGENCNPGVTEKKFIILPIHYLEPEMIEGEPIPEGSAIDWSKFQIKGKTPVTFSMTFAALEEMDNERLKPKK